MYCKLFIFGENKIFALVELPGVEFMNAGDMFVFNGVRYKVMIILRAARVIEFDEFGKRKYNVPEQTEWEISSSPLPELYITDVPQF